MSTRREFITLLAGAAAAWPLAVKAQQPKTPVIGFLHVASASPFLHLVAGFREGLKELGYVEGQNIAIEFRWAEGQYERLPSMAADLVGRKVAVIVTGGGERSIFAAKAATTTIPIIFNIGNNPVAMGLVSSLSRPGGNMTGVNIFTAEVEAKRFGLLHELVPAGSAIAHLVNPDYPPTEFSLKEVQAAARVHGHQIVVLKASNDSDIDAAFGMISKMRLGALLVGADPFFNSRRDQIVALVARHSIPAAYEQREFALAGGLMSYGTNIVDAYRQMGLYTGRVLNGEKPADLPVMQPTKFDFVLNLRTAKTLGLDIPPGVLAIGDEVIE